MDKIQIRKEIESLIQNIKEHFDNALTQDHIPQLELDMVVSKIEKLHQKAIILNYLNNPSNYSHNQTNTVPLTAEVPNKQTDLFGNHQEPKNPAKPSLKTEDIRTHIGINDKFQFITELFEGNENEYSAALNQLNTYPSYLEAEAFLNSIRSLYKWKEDNTFADKFLKIVRKKLK
jgi:hypothetical protein